MLIYVIPKVKPIRFGSENVSSKICAKMVIMKNVKFHRKNVNTQYVFLPSLLMKPVIKKNISIQLVMFYCLINSDYGTKIM